MKTNFRSAEGIGIGAAADVAIALGISADDVLLAVWTHAPGVAPVGQDVSAFAVSEGSIQSATVDTTDLEVYAIWHRL